MTKQVFTLLCGLLFMVSCSGNKQVYADYCSIASSYENWSTVNRKHIDRLCNCGCSNDVDDLTVLLSLASCSNNKQIYAVYCSIASSYGNYSTVNWKRIDSLYYRPYNCDWDGGLDEIITNSQFPKDIAGLYWHLLQNAKTYCHQQSAPVRAVASRKVIQALDNMETMFDTVFLNIVSQDYYMRVFVDEYNQTMPAAFDKVLQAMNEF